MVVTAPVIGSAADGGAEGRGEGGRAEFGQRGEGRRVGVYRLHDATTISSAAAADQLDQPPVTDPFDRTAATDTSSRGESIGHSPPPSESAAHSSRRPRRRHTSARSRTHSPLHSTHLTTATFAAEQPCTENKEKYATKKFKHQKTNKGFAERRGSGWSG